MTLTYFNDLFDLKVGDLVYVEGKFEGFVGRVVEVNYTFKIRASDYKKVIGLADTNVKGRFFQAPFHFFTFDPFSLNYEKVITWFKGPDPKEEEIITGQGDDSFSLFDLSSMKIPQAIAERGHEYYMRERVVYVELNAGKGRAVVKGEFYYELEFALEDMRVQNLLCTCPFSGPCKHQFAAMLQLKEFFSMLEKDYAEFQYKPYFAAMSKGVFFDYVILGKKGAVFTLE